MLLGTIAKNQTIYDIEDIGRMLAEAGVDLGCEEACVDHLVAKGVRPWQFTGSLLAARIEANNIRAMKHWTRKGLRKGGEGLAALLIAGAFLPHDAFAAEVVPKGGALGEMMLALTLALAALIFIVVVFGEDRPGD